MRPKRWVTIGLVLIIVGVVLMIANSVVYGPRFASFAGALKTWANEHAEAPAPNPASFGIDGTAFVVSLILGNAGYILVFIGVAYLVIYVIAQVAKRLGYAKTDPS